MNTREQDLAIREAAQNAASHEYFSTRDMYPSTSTLPAFESGFVRGYDAAAAPMLARIAELESELAQQQDAQPVAWKHDCAALLTNDVELWIDACPHCGKPRIQPAQQGPVAWIRPSGKAMLEAGGYCTAYASDGMSNHSTPLYTHPSPQAKPQP